MEGLDRDHFFKDAVEGRESEIVTRGHSMKLYKKRVRLEVGRWSFGNRPGSGKMELTARGCCD